MANPIIIRAFEPLVQNNQLYQRILSGIFGVELLYSFVIIISSLMVYYSTKELYELSNHKGIKYFRMSFLFFAIAYFFRTFIKFFVLYFNVREVFEIPAQMIGPLTLLIFIYFSTMALFLLLYSLLYKKWKNRLILPLLNLLALLIASISLIIRNPLIILIINLLILSLALFAGNKSYNENKKSKNNLHNIYSLLFTFWILNVVDIVIPNFLATFQLLLYLASTGVFLSILYKTLRRAGE